MKKKHKSTENYKRLAENHRSLYNRRNSNGAEESIMLGFTERREDGVFGDIIVLENGIELFPDDWNGEVYTVKENGMERTFKPIQEPDVVDDDGEVLQWKTVGFEEV